MAQEVKPLSGDRVSDLVAYLLQLPQDARVDVLKVRENGGYDGGYHVESSSINDEDLYYFEGYGEYPKPYLEIGIKP